MVDTCRAELADCQSVTTVILALKGAATYHAFQVALAAESVAVGPTS